MSGEKTSDKIVNEGRVIRSATIKKRAEEAKKASPEKGSKSVDMTKATEKTKKKTTKSPPKKGEAKTGKDTSV